MSAVALLRQLQSPWITRVARQLARGENVRAIFQAQLERLYAAMLASVESGDPEWVDRVLDEWVQARTSSELESRESSIQPLFEQILLITFELAREQLTPGEAIEVLGAVLPVYSHAMQYTARLESTLYVERISGDLHEARLRLEKLDRSKSDFIAIAAHELKTPLTLIEGYSAMLDEYLDEERAAIAPLLKGIHSGTERLRAIVDDMIDVSLIDNNLLNLNFQPVGLAYLLGVVEKEYRPAAEARQITLVVDIFDGSRELLMGDPERLYQALRNVVANGIKYTPDGGSVQVSGRRLPGFVEVSVADTGIGVAPEDQTRIFEKFGRLGDATLHSSGKTKFKGGGPGLGLSITKGIVEAHGGAIWVESDGYDEVKCPGATFHILLPLRVEPPDEKINRLFQTGELVRTVPHR